MGKELKFRISLKWSAGRRQTSIRFFEIADYDPEKELAHTFKKIPDAIHPEGLEIRLLADTVGQFLGLASSLLNSMLKGHSDGSDSRQTPISHNQAFEFSFLKNRHDLALAVDHHNVVKWLTRTSGTPLPRTITRTRTTGPKDFPVSRAHRAAAPQHN